MRQFFSRVLWSCLLVLLLPACTLGPEPIGAKTPAPIVSAEPTTLAQFTPTPTSPPIPQTGLRIWVPPQFSPQGDSPAARLFQAQLDAFSRQHDNVSIEVRTKALEGPGGLLDSLTTANAAAPLALPDLVALPQPMLEAAALKGLLHPLDNLTQTIDDPDWYEYAQEMAHLQTSVFGLPFAGDALILAYRPEVVASPPITWTEVISGGHSLAFAASEPEASVTLAFYQSVGGLIQDEQGRPFLEVAPLQEVLSFYDSASASGAMPFWITQFTSTGITWDAFLEQRSDLVITWSSLYLAERPEGVLAAPLPSQEGTPFSLATGWAWAVPSTLPERHPLSVPLAEYLTQADFLAAWTQAAGYLPPRPSSVRAWNDPTLQALAASLSSSARIYPSADVLTTLGTALNQAAVKVLKQESEPSAAAQEAVNSVVRAAP